MRRSSEDLAEAARNLEESRGPLAQTSTDVGSSTNPSTPLTQAGPGTLGGLSLDDTDDVPPDLSASLLVTTSDLDLDLDQTSDARVSYTPSSVHSAASADRFYRPTQARRKGSAASSRRGSMSSTHSRSSHGLFGENGGGSRSGGGPSDRQTHSGGPQSKYVAQHLRRASILEDRKARLADRAAHAEKVRLRAALARAAAARSNTSASEERALAAQIAREKKLEEIAAACATEVKRAKKVAESMKEKRERAVREMRSQLEERLAEAERRREELRAKAVAGAGHHVSGAVGSMRRSRGLSVGGVGMVGKKGVEILPRVREGKMEDQGHDHEEEEEQPQVVAAQEALKPGVSEEVRLQTAATKIQRLWRRQRRRRDIAAFNTLGLTVERIAKQQFSDVMSLLAEDRVLLATARVLRLCGLREGEPGSAEEMLAVRTFLSAVLILGHPDPVLSNREGEDDDDEMQDGSPSSAAAATIAEAYQREATQTAARQRAATEGMGQAQGPLQAAVQGPAMPLPRTPLSNPQLKLLVDKARRMLETFYSVLRSLSATNDYTPTPEAATELSTLYASFYNAFIAWKARDSKALVEVMVMQMVELDAILQTVKEGPEQAATAQYLDSIRQNQLQLFVRIKRLAGPERGKKLIFDAVREARKARAAAKASAGASSVKPRTIDQAGQESTNGEGQTAAARQPMASEEAPSPAEPMVAAILGTAPGPPPVSASASASAPSGPSSGPSAYYKSDNRVLVHELAINPEYRMPHPSFETLFKEQRRDFEFVRILGSHMQPHAFTPFHVTVYLQALAAIRSGLQRLIMEGSPTWTLVGDMFDVDLAETEIAAGTYSFDKPFQNLSLLLPKLCAPFRDEEVRSLIENELQAESIFDRVAAAIAFLQVMSMDFANYKLSVAAPQLIEAAPAYEARAFAALIQDGQYKLVAAEAAWRAARTKVLAEASRREPDKAGQPANAVGSDKIYAQMLVDLFTLPAPIPVERMPEMLRLDVDRARNAGRLVLRLAATAAILLQTKNLLKRDVRAPWRQEADRILAVIDAAEERSHADAAAATAASSGSRAAASASATPSKPDAGQSSASGASKGAGKRKEKDERDKKAQQHQQQQQQQLSDNQHRRGNNEAAAGSASTSVAAVAADRIAPGRFDSQVAVDGVMAAIETGRCMPSATQAQLRSFVKRVLSAASDAATQQESTGAAANTVIFSDPTEPVLRLLLMRLRTHILSRVGLSAAMDRSRATTTAEKLASLGMPEFVDRVAGLVDGIIKVADVDKAAHGRWWEAVAEVAEAEAATERSQAAGTA